MSEWKEYKLGDIAEVIGGGTPDTSNAEYWNGDIPWLTPKDLTGYNGIFISKGERYITKKGLDNSSAKLLPPGTVLLSSRAPIGYVAIASYSICTNQGFKSIICNPQIVDNLFMYYWIKNNVEYLQSLGTGTTFAEISGSVVKSINVVIPSLDTQRRIASILTSLDDKIDLLRRENATLEAMAETLFRQWFVVEAKEEWEEKPLKEVVDIAIGRTPPRKEAKWFSTNPNDIKWLSIKDMGDNSVFLFNTSEYLTKEAVDEFSIPIIPKNTVVLSFKMTVGRIGITTEDMLSNEAIAHFKFRDETPFSKEYLYLFLKTYKYETLGSTSSIVTAINSAMIKNIEVAIPDDETMRRFRNQTQPMFDKIYSNQEQINILIQTRDGLLPRMMNNEIKL